MTDLGSFAFRGMTIEVCRSVGDRSGIEVLWLTRVDGEFPVGAALVRNGSLVVTNHMGFGSHGPEAAELRAALDAFLVEHGGPVHPGEILHAPPTRSRRRTGR
ncbi:hypothetical protein AB0A73_12350 [Glycomyces sp. NPDC047369]